MRALHRRGNVCSSCASNYVTNSRVLVIVIPCCIILMKGRPRARCVHSSEEGTCAHLVRVFCSCVTNNAEAVREHADIWYLGTIHIWVSWSYTACV